MDSLYLDVNHCIRVNDDAAVLLQEFCSIELCLIFDLIKLLDECWIVGKGSELPAKKEDTHWFSFTLTTDNVISVKRKEEVPGNLPINFTSIQRKPFIRRNT